MNYSYEIVVPRGHAVRFIEALATHVVAGDASRICAAVRTDPAQFMNVVERARQESTQLLDVTFLFPWDEHVTEYFDADGWPESHRRADPATGRAEIGSIWIQFLCGEGYALFCATAVTNAMSCLFESAPTVRSTFIEVAQRSGALLVGFDPEQDTEFRSVWPTERQFDLGDISHPMDCEVPGARVDAYCATLLELARIHREQT